MEGTNIFKRIISAYNSVSLILRICAGIVIGAILGILLPGAGWLAVLGNLFVGALKAIAPVLVFSLVSSSIAKGAARLDRRFGMVILLYLITTLLASLIAVTASFVFPQTITLVQQVEIESAPAGIGQVLNNLLVNAVSNPIDSLVRANYIGILTWALIFGFSMKKFGSETSKTMFTEIAQGISQIVRWIINLAPFGILGLVFETVSTNGLGIFTNYGKLLLVLVGSMLFMNLIVSPVIVAILLKRNPYPLVFRCIRESGITAFFTRSSAANIPVNMELCEKLGLDEDMYSVSIPLGATINMDGAAITIAVMTLAAANTLGISVDIPTALILCVLATLGACGASGVAGGSLLLIPLACSLFGISNDIAMQVVGVGFIIGVVQDSMETALNSSSDVLFTATAEYYSWKKAGKPLPEKF
ncbi:MAG: serine/threonine transporter SstT [Spirochaetaceae bacterium]|nr:serine/threonine transporter SstT [Spirochaetaceae bacterium]